MGNIILYVDPNSILKIIF